MKRTCSRLHTQVYNIGSNEKMRKLLTTVSALFSYLSTYISYCFSPSVTEPLLGTILLHMPFLFTEVANYIRRFSHSWTRCSRYRGELAQLHHPSRRLLYLRQHFCSSSLPVCPPLRLALRFDHRLCVRTIIWLFHRLFGIILLFVFFAIIVGGIAVWIAIQVVRIGSGIAGGALELYRTLLLCTSSGLCIKIHVAFPHV